MNNNLLILGTYDHLRSSGFSTFPHKSTLLEYTGFTNMSTGYNYDIINKFIDDIKLSILSEHEKNVSLLLDEMKIKSGLVFSRSKRRLVGFTDLGDINNELDEFNRFIKPSCGEQDLATHVLTLMASGLFNISIIQLAILHQ